ncbi:MAG: DUF115 domain-containing protein [Spirochaetales bacterium]|nr:DUF115 domain-containing protein [Spirochaetales bacterium]
MNAEDEPRLRETGRGLTIHYRGRYLYSSRDPAAAPRRQAGSARLEPGTLVFVPSLGLGYGLRELLERLPERCHVLCVEADPALMTLAAASGIPLPHSDHLTIVRLDAPAAAAALLRSLRPWRFRRLAEVPLCSAHRLAPGVYRSIRETLEEEIRLFWQNKITLVEMSRLWLRNLIGNLPLLPGARAAHSLKTTAPIVVTGAGPSLERALEGLLAIRPRVRLLATDTSLPTLRAAGLRPDWVCVLEAQVHNLQDFVPDFDPSLHLVCDLTASPTVLHRFPQRTFFAARFHPLALFRRLSEHGILPTPLPPLGSVGVTAVELALRMTSGPVLLAGLDFSYLPGRTHARGAPAHLAPLSSGWRLRPPGTSAFEALLLRPRLALRGRSGSRVESDLTLSSYALQLERLIGASGRVYDLTGEGLPCGALPVQGPRAIERLLSRASRQDRPGSPDTRAETPPRFAPSPQAVETFCRAEAALLRRTEERLVELLEKPPEGARGNAGAGKASDRPRSPGGQELPAWLLEAGYLLLPIAESEPERILARPSLVQLLAGARYFQNLLRRTAETAAG